MAHVSVYVAILDVLYFSAPVNKFPVGITERHLRHHVNLNINYNNKYKPKKSSAVTLAHIVCLFFFLQGNAQRDADILTQAPLSNTNEDFWRMVS